MHTRARFGMHLEKDRMRERQTDWKIDRKRDGQKERETERQVANIILKTKQGLLTASPPSLSSSVFFQTHSIALSRASPGQTELGRLAWHSAHVIDLLSSRKISQTSDSPTNVLTFSVDAEVVVLGWRRASRGTLRINAVKFCRSASELTW